MPPRVNLRSSAVKRIMQEAAEATDPDTDGFVATPLESDIFEWHCTLRGVKGTEYEGGLYHLRILLPASYPMSAPDIVLLTPNGRFELGKKICIDGLTSFHAGSWQPAWGIRTAITGLRAFWTQEGEALSAIGALDVPKEERRRLAKLSRDWTCSTCGERNATLLPDSPEGSKIISTEALAEQPDSKMKEEPPRSKSPASDMHLAAEDVANADLSPIIPFEAIAPVAVSPAGHAAHFPARQDTDPSQAVLGQETQSATQPPLIPDPAPITDETPIMASHTPSIPTPLDAPSPNSGATPVSSHPTRLGPVPLAPTPTTDPVLRRRGTSPPPPLLPAAPPPAPVAAGHGAVPARFTVPPPAPARSAPLWLDALIGALVVLLLYLLTGRA
ncbi:hypothetical protein CcaverHIS002_0603310 [Cutaneotrichosporon cavernicola]|nr:hypothetical protein CcaverHIS002_0603310 [Cutaneotrichosporon cavernicola]